MGEKSRNKNGNIRIWVFILITISIFLFYDIITKIPKWVASYSWLETKGIILDLSFKEIEDDEGNISYNVYVKYEYILDGKKYIGKNINLGSSSWSISGNQKKWFKENYKIGNTVTVYFNPDFLSEAILVKGIAGGEYFKIIFAIILLSGGILIYYFTIIKVSKKDNIEEENINDKEIKKE